MADEKSPGSKPNKVEPMDLKAESDETLMRLYSLLSDERIMRNVDRLAELEAELRVRGLPLTRSQ